VEEKRLAEMQIVAFDFAVATAYMTFVLPTMMAEEKLCPTSYKSSLCHIDNSVH
jgi:hypothetical protein